MKDQVKNAAAKTKRPTDQVPDKLRVQAARQAFVVSSLAMTWRLAVVVLGPLLVGVKIDNHFHSSPAYTLMALFLAMIGAGWVIKGAFNAVSRPTRRREAKPV